MSSGTGTVTPMGPNGDVELDSECEHSNLNFKIFARGLHVSQEKYHANPLNDIITVQRDQIKMSLFHFQAIWTECFDTTSVRKSWIHFDIPVLALMYSYECSHNKIQWKTNTG